MTTGKRIKQIRQSLGMTQSKFAGRISVSTSYIAGMELGSKKVNDRTIRLISTEFGINAHWLRTGEGEMFSGETDTGVIKAVSLFKSLPLKFRECALNQLNELVELHNASKLK